MIVFTDSKYTFLAVYAHGAMWKEGRLLISGNREIKHAKEILEVTRSCFGIQGGSYCPLLGTPEIGLIAQENNQADQTAKFAAPMKDSQTLYNGFSTRHRFNNISTPIFL